MKQEVAEKWVEALRSGNYRQTKHTLKDNTGAYCCLGVLQEVVLGLPTKGGYLSDDAKRSADMGSAAGQNRNGHWPALSIMNDDDGKSFDQIADYIEAHYKNL